MMINAWWLLTLIPVAYLAYQAGIAYGMGLAVGMMEAKIKESVR